MSESLKAVNWDAELHSIPIEDKWTKFSTTLNDEMKKHISKTTPGKDKRRKIWMTREATAKHRKKQRAWKKYRQTGDRIDYIRATTEKNELITMKRKLCHDFERNLARQLKENPKAFWRYCGSKLKGKTRLGELKAPDGSTANEDHEKAELFNQYFASVFTHETLNDIPAPELKHQDPALNDITFTEEEVERKLEVLNPAKSAGPDGFHPRVLKELSGAIKLPLSIIMTGSFMEGRLPEEWNSAHVTAIHKKGPKAMPENYRPISLTSVVGKLMESIVRDQLM